MVGACPAASAPLDELLYCARQQCAAECSGGQGCSACVASRCGSAYASCQAQRC
jgi:hypothetical protein